MHKEAIKPLQPYEYPAKAEAEKYNRLKGPVFSSPLLKRIGALFAVTAVGGLATACQRDVYVSVEECNQPYPEVCTSTETWDEEGIAVIHWQSPEGTVKNNIYERNTLNEQKDIVTGIGHTIVVLQADSSIDDVNFVDANKENGLVLRANPNKEHYISIEACKAAEDCIPSEEVVIPKKR